MSRGNAEEEAETGTKMISHQKYTFEVLFDTDFECILLMSIPDCNVSILMIKSVK